MVGRNLGTLSEGKSEYKTQKQVVGSTDGQCVGVLTTLIFSRNIEEDERKSPTENAFNKTRIGMKIEEDIK
jgi:hypothetical protein